MGTCRRYRHSPSAWPVSGDAYRSEPLSTKKQCHIHILSPYFCSFCCRPITVMHMTISSEKCHQAFLIIHNFCYYKLFVLYMDCVINSNSGMLGM